MQKLVHFSNIIIVLLLINKTQTQSKTYTNNNVKPILSPVGKQLDIICDANVNILYCSVTHPNGTEFTAISSDSDMPYRYDDSEFGNGKCKFSFNKGSYEDNGLWTCHIGQSYPLGIEEQNTIEVKIVGEITALEPILKVHLGKSVNISCAATDKSRSLKYCRFSPPNGPRFSIDEKIKFKNAILQQYYFKDGCELWKGDCAITIIKVSHEHLGKWTCSAMTDENNNEHSDNIILEMSREQLSTASVVGLIFGIFLSVIIVTGLAYFVWRQRRYNPMNTEMGSPEPAPSRSARQEVSVQYEARPSGISDSSETQLAFVPDIHKQTTYGASTSTQVS